MNFKPLNISVITAGISALLTKALPQLTVERSAEVNELPHRCPWVGIYRSGVEYPLRTLGMGSGFRGQRINLVLMVQNSDATSGEECEERLEELIVNVIGALLSDPTLNNTVDGLDEFSVQYVDYLQTDAGYVQTAGIYFTALSSVRA